MKCGTNIDILVNVSACENVFIAVWSSQTKYVKGAFHITLKLTIQLKLSGPHTANWIREFGFGETILPGRPNTAIVR